MVMTPPEIAQMKAWIDSATYRQLLAKWRFEPVGSAWFQGEIGNYYEAAMKEKKAELPSGVQVAASKAVGWDRS
jgi:hypothetical protein